MENLFNYSNPEAPYEAGHQTQNWIDNPESRNDEHTMEKQVKTKKVGGIKNKQIRQPGKHKGNSKNRRKKSWIKQIILFFKTSSRNREMHGNLQHDMFVCLIWRNWY